MDNNYNIDNDDYNDLEGINHGIKVKLFLKFSCRPWGNKLLKVWHWKQCELNEYKVMDRLVVVAFFYGNVV